MNSNLFHNLANAATALIALITAVLTLAGCDTNAAGALDCSHIDAAYAGYASIVITVIQALKLGVNVARDGVSGLTKPQPPVQDYSPTNRGTMGRGF